MSAVGDIPNGSKWATGPSDRPRIPEGPDGERRGFPWESAVGTIYIRPIEADRVIVDNSMNTVPDRPGRPYLTVRGIEYTATVGVSRDEDGAWKCSENVHAHRKGSYTDASVAAEKKLVEAFEAAVTEWASTDEAQALLVEAEQAWANNLVYQQRQKVEEAHRKFLEQQDALDEKLYRLTAANNARLALDSK